jgi:hypothetical protein
MAKYINPAITEPAIIPPETSKFSAISPPKKSQSWGDLLAVTDQTISVKPL